MPGKETEKDGTRKEISRVFYFGFYGRSTIRGRGRRCKEIGQREQCFEHTARNSALRAAPPAQIRLLNAVVRLRQTPKNAFASSFP
jgi:hypothetical protein